ncbi:hypothetical protein Q9189_007358 [Teloschistes chrysophthalmus]
MATSLTLKPPAHEPCYGEDIWAQPAVSLQSGDAAVQKPSPDRKAAVEQAVQQHVVPANPNPGPDSKINLVNKPDIKPANSNSDGVVTA